MGSAVERLRGALEAGGCVPRGGSAKCPAHEDRTASLSFTQGKRGALVNCHAGCDTREILEALGLTWDDLFDEPRERKVSPVRRFTETERRDQEVRADLRKAVRVINITPRDAEPPPVAGCAVWWAEAEEKREQQEHFARVQARHAALACDEEFVRDAYRTLVWRRSYEQNAVLALRREMLDNGEIDA